MWPSLQLVSEARLLQKHTLRQDLRAGHLLETWPPGHPGLGSEIRSQGARCEATYHGGLLELCPLGNPWWEMSHSTLGQGGWCIEPGTPAPSTEGSFPIPSRADCFLEKEGPRAKSGPGTLSRAAPAGWRWAPGALCGARRFCQLGTFRSVGPGRWSALLPERKCGVSVPTS